MPMLMQASACVLGYSCTLPCSAVPCPDPAVPCPALSCRALPSSAVDFSLQSCLRLLSKSWQHSLLHGACAEGTG